ncbi:MAG: multicopper oxidase domain-containing protein [Acidimicrobiia bacterium]|nr:multicopper oxidase domain-containing protein [Acidimicrobiia bacterium]
MTQPTNDARGSVFDKFLLLVGVMAAGAMILAVIAVAAGGSDEPSGPGDSGDPVASPPPDQIQTAHFELSEFAITGDLDIRPGETRFEVHNAGAVIHNLELVGGSVSPDLTTGESAVFDVGALAPGTYTIICNIAGHREAGMEARLVVSEDAGETGGDHGDDHEIDYEELDAVMMESMLEFPAATEGKGNQPLEPAVLEDGTLEFELTAAITPWEVEPGKIVDAWSYNGMVPGPQIRIDVGDHVRVIVHNELPMGTDVHWHGIATPNSMDGVAPITQDLIRSGETFVYEFTATRPAIGMYHAHHHAQMQVPNGMFGSFIIGDTPLPRGQVISGIEIPEDLEIDHEIPMVLNDAGVIGLSLNGKSFPATEPYVGNVGDWVVVHYYNEGLQIHPMHQHQFPQLVFAKDGIPLDYPYFADTVNVAPGERYSVLFQLTDPGVWVWHCHILTHVESHDGMFGMVTAWIVEE